MVLTLDQFLNQQYPDNSIVRNGILIRRGRLVLGGYQGTGKTNLVTQLGLELTCGDPFIFNYGVTGPQRVLLIQEEISPRSYQERLRKAIVCYPSINPDAFGLLSTLSLRVDTREGRREIEQAINQFQPNVLILDPLYKFHSADENSQKEMKGVTDYLDELLDKHNLAIVLTHHLRKPSTWQGKQMAPTIFDFRGQSHITAWADSRLLLHKGPDFYTLSFDLRNAPEEEPQVTIDFDRDKCVFRIVHPPAQIYIDYVIHTLHTNGRVVYQDLSKQMIADLSVSQRTFERTVGWLRGRGDVEVVGNGRYPRMIGLPSTEWQVQY